jgi:hypothetical protein
MRSSPTTDLLDRLDRRIAQMRAQAKTPGYNWCELVAEDLEAARKAVADQYSLGLLAEEMGEAIQRVGKWLRFGADHTSRAGQTPRGELAKELGDVEAAIDFAVADTVVDGFEVLRQQQAKRFKLLDPASLDDQGNRLAPQPRGAS